MTIATMTTISPAVIDPKTSLSDPVRSFWKTMKFRNQQRRSVRHLHSMSDYHLRDVGIHRSEIASMVYGRYDKRVPTT